MDQKTFEKLQRMAGEILIFADQKQKKMHGAFTHYTQTLAFFDILKQDNMDGRFISERIESMQIVLGYIQNLLDKTKNTEPDYDFEKMLKNAGVLDEFNIISSQHADEIKQIAARPYKEREAAIKQFKDKNPDNWTKADEMMLSYAQDAFDITNPKAPKALEKMATLCTNFQKALEEALEQEQGLT